MTGITEVTYTIAQSNEEYWINGQIAGGKEETSIDFIVNLRYSCLPTVRVPAEGKLADALVKNFEKAKSEDGAKISVVTVQLADELGRAALSGTKPTERTMELAKHYLRSEADGREKLAEMETGNSDQATMLVRRHALLAVLEKNPELSKLITTGPIEK